MNSVSLGKMYLLPKIHKGLESVPGRPVISNCGSPTEKVSEFLDHHLQPLMKSGKSFLKDTNHFLQKLSKLGVLPRDAILVTADVVGLYPNIPHDIGLKYLMERLNERQNKRIPTNILVEMAHFVLNNNYFEFNNEIYHQISGTAIGTKFAPPYACIFMDRVENDFLETEKFKPYIWLRYIDDIFFIWTYGLEKLESFLSRLNGFHPTLKFTHNHSKKFVNFLDVSVKINEGKIETDLYIKPTDCHQYLHYDSSHPLHVKLSIVYSQGLRVRRICSSDEKIENHFGKLQEWFCKRGYPSNLVQNQLEKSKSKLREELFLSNNKKTSCGVPLILTFSPILKEVSKTLREYLPLLYTDRRVKEVFTPAPFVSFRNGFSLKNHLVRAKVKPLERKRGSTGCKNVSCLTCNNLSETLVFCSNVTNEIFKINHQLDCNSQNIVYLLSCKVCGIQYVGQTSTRFRLRWNNYKSEARRFTSGKDVQQKFLHEHFAGENHNDFESDCMITIIDKSDPQDPTRRERYWIHRLKTLMPLGLNIEENV